MSLRPAETTAAPVSAASAAPTLSFSGLAAGPSAASDGKPDPRWARVSSRDASADGQFVYAVRTTGVYCRPSCASRRANPENVSFHATPAEADALGFRPCKRCRPQEASADARIARQIAAACALADSAESPPSLAQMAAAAAMSPSRFHRVFKARMGLAPRAYAAAARAERLRKALREASSATNAMLDAGFSSSGRFYETAPKALGMPVKAWRAGGDKEAIRFAVGQSSLGALLVAQSGLGVCAIFLGDDPQALIGQLQERFPNAELAPGGRDFDETVALAAGMVERPSEGLALPLDLRGTAFQRRVWEALRGIRPGERVTYAELAQRVGLPQGARAVASACAANALAIAIPCHRVVRQGGALSGYRWGVERKAALLERETPEAGPASAEASAP